MIEGEWPPKFENTTCQRCGQAIEHTGANHGISWVLLGTRDSGIRAWLCSQEAPGVWVQHVPAEQVAFAEIDQAIESIVSATRDVTPDACA